MHDIGAQTAHGARHLLLVLAPPQQGPPGSGAPAGTRELGARAFENLDVMTVAAQERRLLGHRALLSPALAVTVMQHQDDHRRLKPRLFAL